MKKICKQCGKEFELTDSEIEYFKSKNLSVPKRCKACRDQNKASKKDSMQVTGNYTHSYSRPSGSGFGGKVLGGVAAVAVVLVILIGIYVRNMVFNPVSDADTGIEQTVTQVEIPKVDVEVSKPEVNVEVEKPKVDVEVEEPKVEVEKPKVDVETDKTEAEITVEKPVESEQPLVETQQIEEVQAQTDAEPEQPVTATYRFRNKKLLNQHYDKHGKEMGFASAAEYEAAASAVITNPNALYKTEKEDGDGCYFIESTNEFVVLSTDGYIRTYFIPDSGKKYFDKQ